jgi:hypothetical protein
MAKVGSTSLDSRVIGLYGMHGLTVLHRGRLQLTDDEVSDADAGNVYWCGKPY